MFLHALRLGCILLVGLTLAAGCVQQDKPAGTPLEQAWEKPAAPPVPAEAGKTTPEPLATQPAGVAAVEPAGAPESADPIVAVVNGRPIPRARLVGMLVETHGLPLLEQMILLTAAEQRAAEMGLKITQADVTAAQEDALRRISMPLGSEGAPLDRPAAEKLLGEFLAAKNLSAGEWDLRMRQRACVRKIAEAEVAQTKVTGPMLREEHVLAFGERVQIRHIQVSSLSAVSRVKAALEKSGDFAAVARELSENQITGASGGLLPPFTRNDPDVPPLIRETAFRMQPGETSPAVQQDNWYHIIKVERRFPASGVSFDNADQEALKKRLLERLTRQRQETLEAELFRSAHVDIHDAGLAKGFREKNRK